ncbi:magnesium-translocating P-type ATPase [Luteitalea sp. TBR-22]|uniref:magnesium-translocating P-type ATPase n=1 Tax=Luteitalea sp. TBR-22 TaxID=2802971 RepID=UPI001AF6D733|nr:magnesium-translocating P-type ATPase [Luteitalea sp. TBR-22]BCS35051.1 magnesium-translocating P-type ATPase [Luteitalea sp. TBR-22]
MSSTAEAQASFWDVPVADLLRDLHTSRETGLPEDVAATRLRIHGPNTLRATTRFGPLRLLLHQFTSPIELLLVVAATLSWALHDSTDAAIILCIVLASGVLGFWQEQGASTTIAKLLAVVEVSTTVVRAGQQVRLPVDRLVPGDIVLLQAGSSIPGDGRVLESRDLQVNEATLTGETFPVEKRPGAVPSATPLGQRWNCVFMGTSVVSGTAAVLITRTGGATELGHLSQLTQSRAAATEFERGIRRFGAFLMDLTVVFVLAIFAVNVYLARPVVDAFLFALALAVGLTPQLLPAIVTVTLARGARRMAERRVIVKRLASIENFGSMDVLCSDKTGTLTEGRVRVRAALDIGGVDSEAVLFHAFLNASFQTGYANPIDAAIREGRPLDVSAWRRVDELPYDFTRKRLSVLLQNGDATVIVTKGAVESVLSVCTLALGADGSEVPLQPVIDRVRAVYASVSAQGFRTLAVARRPTSAAMLQPGDERDLTLLGLLVLDDPLKADAATTVASLAALGVSLKIITGDNQLVAAEIARQLGMDPRALLTGAQVHGLNDDALALRVADVEVFAEIEPNQKERLIRALRASGHVVGYIGDGINDGPALHAADVGISVQGAADVAKGAADIVLLEHSLRTLEDGVREGRRTFANTIKYVLMATSANFGNMFSMAGAALWLPFLPLLPKQILLANLLTDVPELTIATDRVDDEWIARPHRWDVEAIRRFMIVFGILSSVFDYATFAVLVWGMHANADEFRTGWFVESLASATLIVLIVRTRHPVLTRLPSQPLLLSTLAVLGLSLVLPFSPVAGLFGFVPLPASFMLSMAAIVAAYAAAAEVVKRAFYRRFARS